jgi:small-conductance mechanosensitive channel
MGRLRCGGDGFGGLDDKLFMLMTRRRGSATIWLALLRLIRMSNLLTIQVLTRGEMVRNWFGIGQRWNSMSKRRGVGVAGVLILMVAALTARPVAFSQQAQNEDAAARSKEIMAHLNMVVQYYQLTMQPIQKAGEPNDVVYRDQATQLSVQIAQYAFQSAKAQAALAASSKAGGNDAPAAGEQQKMQAVQANVEAQITEINSQVTALDQQIAVAKPKNLAALQAQKKQLEGALELSNAMKGALGKIVGMGGAVGGSGLSGQIAALQSSAKSAGITSQAAVLIDMLGTRSDLRTLLHDEDKLHQQAITLRAPLITVLRQLIQQGQQLSQQAATAGAGGAAPASGGSPASGGAAAASQPTIQAITKQFNALSGATVPLSQEIIVLEQSRANLMAWQTSVNQEYDEILHAVLLRVIVILIALGIIVGGGEIWRRATNKYVQDLRRRRQFLIVRRVVVGFLSGLVILFGFVTQFNSLATFAGFITAGIAVGLQTILLSVAAYFFIIGRYGIKVGDRITIATVTGDVIDVGLVRFYMMELAGTGSELNPTGRVAVFSNAVLFQAGTPLYKQIPGTHFAWHELTIKLADGANYKLIADAVVKEVNAVYEEHRGEIEQQHRGVEDQMQMTMNQPVVESRIQLTGGAFQLWVRFPVAIQHAAEMDEKLSEALVGLVATNPEVKSGVAAMPVIQASVRG